MMMAGSYAYSIPINWSQHGFTVTNGRWERDVSPHGLVYVVGREIRRASDDAVLLSNATDASVAVFVV